MKRPFPITFLGGMFIAIGLASLGYHLLKNPLDRSTVPIAIVGVTATVAGVFLIRGRPWARWLVLAWLALHVVVGAFHSLSDTLAHLALLIAVGYFLLTPPASRYFHPGSSE